MWLSAKIGIEKEVESGDKLSEWTNPHHEEPYTLKAASSELSPIVVESNGKPGVQFSNDNFGVLVQEC
jgi:hypothetical protein